jgi:hypothetical protein
MMRTLLSTALATVLGASGMAFAAGPAQETVTVWQVDTSGRPPYKRERVELPVVDTARMELTADADVETVRVWTVDRSGKPPYQRRFEELPVTDIAAMELEAEQAAKDVRFRGRPPFQRHR